MGEHDIVEMTITDTKQIRDNTVPSTAPNVIRHSIRPYVKLSAILRRNRLEKLKNSECCIRANLLLVGQGILLQKYP